MPEFSRWKGDAESGSSTIEFAAILPLLILFLFGTVEFGTFFLRHQVLQDAVILGARNGALFRADCDATQVTSEVRAAVAQSATLAGVQTAEGDVVVEGVCDSTPFVRVSIERPASFPVLAAFSLDFPDDTLLDVSSAAANQNASSD